jgi:hypothetical protein
MHIYMAAIHSNGYKHTMRYEKLNDFEKKIFDKYPHLLESYHYIHKPQYVDAIGSYNDKVFLDSGAFSAYTLGVDIKVEDYCNYIERNNHIVRFEDGVMLASVLDGIGDPLLTYQNQKRMEAAGVTPLPCFHAGEDERYLQYYVDNYPYITLGGMVGASTKQLITWLDRMWGNYLINEDGSPKLKVHAFGITSLEIMKRYPWYSVDSSSWIQFASFGNVITPEFGAIQVSSKSPARFTWGQHYTTFTPIEREKIYNLFLSQGFEYERLATVYESRAAYNVLSFGRINDQLNDRNHTHYKPVRRELF